MKLLVTFIIVLLLAACDLQTTGSELVMSWPKNADGDVFRRMQASKFDFSSAHEIDFNVDFANWPPSPEAIQWLEQEYSAVSISPPSSGMKGYVQFQVTAKVTYDLVISTQDRVSEAMAKYGGVCESWGVMQEAP